ncbi:MAG: pyridoxamine 5'-phosphate oxidase family protein [Nitriliruptorales bacterium]|nr:pyridoxamine 5'-phosphate oxidase family protein [Nitriliruptorales bacterium]
MRARRPPMADGYGIRERDDDTQMVDWAWVAERAAATPNWWVCTTNSDGSPHAAPVWGVWVDDAVWFSTGSNTVKGRNLRRDPRVVVHVESGDEMVLVHGEAEFLMLDEASEQMAGVDAAYAGKYTDPETGKPFALSETLEGGGHVIRIRAQRVLAWKEYDFVNSAAEFVP